MEGFLMQVGIGAVSGFFVAGAGYLKSFDNVTGYKEQLEIGKFLKTIILGAFVGAGVSATGLPTEAIVALPMYAGITTVVENGIKWLFRR